MARAVTLAILASLASPQDSRADPPILGNIKHFVVIYLENRSFDHLFGDFPGANNRSKAGPESLVQTDKHGKPYTQLPAVLLLSHGQAPQPDTRFPQNLPNAPFDIGRHVPPTAATGDLKHSFYSCQGQINHGRMDRFAAGSDAGALSFGYYATQNSHLYRLAQEFTLADNFFQAAFGGSFINHQWLIAARTPQYPDAPGALKSTLQADGTVADEKPLTPDGFTVNTLQPSQAPFDPKYSHRLPALDYPNIGDRLSEKHISWAWYAGGWNDALAGRADQTFQYHHQPFVYFKNYAPNTPERNGHLKDYADLEKAIKQNKLPNVVFYKPLGKANQHSGYSTIAAADEHIGKLVESLRHGKQWRDMAIIITYDEFGGYWDHVPPPQTDRWGPGPRIPAIIVSPHAKQSYIDSTQYDTTSILATLERRFGLAPLTERDAKAHDLRNAFKP